MAAQRSKEIGIRKVLGSSVSGIVVLLNKEFLNLVIIAALISWPLTWFIMQQWLQHYAYRIKIAWWIFAATGLIVFLIALLTVSWQALRVARANPADSLRYE